MDSQKRFVQGHAFSITSVDLKSRTLQIVNPWNTASSRHNLSFDEFFKYFGSLETTTMNIPAIKRDFGNLPFLSRDTLASHSVPGQAGYLENGQIYSYDSSRPVTVKVLGSGGSEFPVELRLHDGKMQIFYPNYRNSPSKGVVKTLDPGESVIVGRDLTPGVTRSAPDGGDVMARYQFEVHYTSDGKLYVRNISSDFPSSVV